ncbi:MAG: Holliday junction resolvase RuvX [Candidatus Omnitrophica bacterium]|nr:Holliday junction resolvase RuvX [Candidatus Omnitrophota bacterium]
MRILGIDYGLRHVGLALSDVLGIVAQGLETFHYAGSIDTLVQKIQEVVKRHKVTEVVIGLPLNMNGTKGEKAKETESVAQRLKEATGLSIHLWDERLTTVGATRELSRWRLGIEKKKKLLDRLSAQLILQSYLDFQRSRAAS